MASIVFKNWESRQKGESFSKEENDEEEELLTKETTLLSPSFGRSCGRFVGENWCNFFAVPVEENAVSVGVIIVW